MPYSFPLVFSVIRPTAQNEDLARQLVELGQRGNGDTMTREEFELRKREIDEQKFATLNKQPKVCILSTVACASLACFCQHLYVLIFSITLSACPGDRRPFATKVKTSTANHFCKHWPRVKKTFATASSRYKVGSSYCCIPSFPVRRHSFRQRFTNTHCCTACLSAYFRFLLRALFSFATGTSSAKKSAATLTMRTA